jgi:excisionase family DNA binding protein
MENIILSPIHVNELSLLIEDSVRKALKDIPTQVKAPEPESDLINIEEAATILNLSVQTIYGLTSSRKLRHFKKGKRLYFSKNEIVEWIKSGRKKSVSDLRQELIN